MRNFFLGTLVGVLLLHTSVTSAFGTSDLHMAAESLKSMSHTLRLIDEKLGRLTCR
jgi:hypothetical protein